MVVRAARPTLILITMVVIMMALLVTPARAHPDSPSCPGKSCQARAAAVNGSQDDEYRAQSRQRQSQSAKAQRTRQHEAQKADRHEARAAAKAARKDSAEPAPPSPGPPSTPDVGGPETGTAVSPPTPAPPVAPAPAPTSEGTATSASDDVASPGPQAEPSATEQSESSGLVSLPGVAGLVDDLLDAVRDVEAPGPRAILRPFSGQPADAVGGVSLLLALLGAFLALQRGIGRGIGHVPMSNTPTWRDVDGST